MKNENKAFYVTFTALVDNQYKEVSVAKPFRKFDMAEAFADACMTAWNNTSLFKYTGYTVSFH